MCFCIHVLFVVSLLVALVYRGIPRSRYRYIHTHTHTQLHSDWIPGLAPCGGKMLLVGSPSLSCILLVVLSTCQLCHKSPVFFPKRSVKKDPVAYLLQTLPVCRDVQTVGANLNLGRCHREKKAPQKKRSGAPLDLFSPSLGGFRRACGSVL